MTPAWQGDGVTIYQGDVVARLADLPAASIQTVVTSPPYWGLRDYGTGRWEGGDEACDHSQALQRKPSTFNASFNERWGNPSGQEKQEHLSKSGLPAWSCECGAVRVDEQIGLEETPEAYVARMVEVFRGVRRVLRDDGTVWLNLGDSYCANRSYQVSDTKHQAHDFAESNAMKVPHGLKPKDLVGVPWRVAFALQADGWYLRADIIWAKSNPMPESIRDRPTKAHEYLFLLTKSARYYYDHEAVKEPATWARWGAQTGEKYAEANSSAAMVQRRTKKEIHEELDTTRRNLRSVWNVATEPCPEAHFAVMPTKLVEPCIKAGSKPGDTVLDPFMGSGTTALVARRLDRYAIGVELNPDYIKIAERRVSTWYKRPSSPPKTPPLDQLNLM